MRDNRDLSETAFTTDRAGLQQVRQRAEEGRMALFLARERVKEIAAEQARLHRVFDKQNRTHLARRRQLEAEREEAEAAVENTEAEYRRWTETALDRFRQFTAIDPRDGIENLSDSTPFLLLPVRIETRFKRTSEGTGARHQLWVRVYPDDVAVDTFEPVLSDTEIANARLYWIEVWRAAGDADRERGAWRSLVGSHGSGRAAWVIGNYQPTNLAAKPAKANPQDVVLTIPTETPLPAGDVPAVAAYWSGVWLADGAKAKVAAELTTLEAQLGAARAAEIVKSYRPVNLDETPPAPWAKSEVASSVAEVVFASAGTMSSKRDSWSQPARVNVMPDRLVLLGYVGGKLTLELLGHPIPAPLIVGPDPSSPEGDQFRAENSEIVVNEDLRWMIDFERAVETGMGFVVDLTAEQYRRGFDRLLVLGARLSADEAKGTALLETLLHNHQHSRTGFSLLPQGSPTNNTEQEGTSFTQADDPDASYTDLFEKDDLFQQTAAWMEKPDGQWLAEFLGIDPKVLAKTRHSGGMDQSEVRAMNTALWPATLGYFMDSMMEPVFDGNTIEQTRWFFNHFVSGRGMIPAVRIGQQPYGILPATAFSRARWPYTDRTKPFRGLPHPKGHQAFLRGLHTLLSRAQADWDALQDEVAYVGKQGDPQQVLLDALGLHAGSVEYYQRYAESADQIYNSLNLKGLGGALLAWLIAAQYTQTGVDLLNRLGYTGQQKPEILEKFFLLDPNKLSGPVIDDRPLSEIEKIRAYTSAPNAQNYIEWLASAARTSLETIRQQKGFTDNRPPTALLYIMLRHATILGYWDASLRLYEAAAVLTGNALRQARLEPKFVHMGTDAVSESRWHYLYQPEPRITGRPDLTVADFIPQRVGQIPEARYLHDQLEALGLLGDAPTARLERAFAEHVDCATYRFDAWKLGLTGYRLASMRYGDGSQSGALQGIYLGMFGWLEHVRPETRGLRPVSLDSELAAIFERADEPPLIKDTSNAGFIHAPSLNHAVTAAVLRNGYREAATAANPSTLAVNLSSERVRRALGILEGIRNGQSLAALLGYRFERGLHDSHNLAEVDGFIYDLRKAFPLVAGRFKTTPIPADVSIEALEARNVMDGLALINHINATRVRKYPFGKSLPPASPSQAAAIDAEVEKLFDLHDAVADLALAESLHQVVQGNYGRAAATADAYGKATFPPIPDVIQTPRSGIGLTHRVALHLEAGLSPNISPIAGLPVTPRAKAEPAINKWLASVLPDPAQVACTVAYTRAIDGAAAVGAVTQAMLGLQPIDLLYTLSPESQQAMTVLDDRVIRYVYQNFAPRADSSIEIRYTERTPGKVSFFELAALMQSLSALLLQSRPLRPDDIALPDETEGDQDAAISLDLQRVAGPRADMAPLKTALGSFASNLDALLKATPPNTAGVTAGIDTTLDTFAGLFTTASAFAVPQSGFGFAYEWRRSAFPSLLAKVNVLLDRWQDRLDQFDAFIVEYAALPAGATDEERFTLLHQAELQVSAEMTTPMPPTPTTLEAAVYAKRTAFSYRRSQFAATVGSLATSLSAAHAAVANEMAADTFGWDGFDLSAEAAEVMRFAGELSTRAASLAVELGKRMSAADSAIATYQSSASAEAQVQALQGAGSALFGEEFRMVPEFALASDQGDEWAVAWNSSAALLNDLTTSQGVDYPIDDWLHGVARVREKMHHWENLVFLTSAFGRAEPELRPIQLPHRASDPWLALAFPQGTTIDGDRLLYTAHYATPFDKTKQQCGLLLDEWTEVIPAEDETTGVAFHYDRPSSEPPQVMLLVAPPDIVGHWRWDDLVDALHETLEMAKVRAVEPDQVDDTPYARFLPATLMAVSMYPITIAANLSANNQIATVLKVEDNE